MKINNTCSAPYLQYNSQRPTDANRRQPQQTHLVEPTVLVLEERRRARLQQPRQLVDAAGAPAAVGAVELLPHQRGDEAGGQALALGVEDEVAEGLGGVVRVDCVFSACVQCLCVVRVCRLRVLMVYV